MPSLSDLTNRTHSLFTSTISGEVGGVPYVLGQPLQKWVQESSLADIVGSLFLGRPLKSERTKAAIDTILKLCIDHGPYQSGVVNTMITARAGRDMVSSVASGLLTIGPRFGGATNEAARIWHTCLSQDPHTVVEDFAQRKIPISGIGHKSYRVDKPDPRVTLITLQVDHVTSCPHLDFARAIERVTTGKKTNLILNVDGTIAAVMLDLLQIEEGLSETEIAKLIEVEFFNAFFVWARTAGFIAHYLDQKRLAEPLFRLPEREVLTIK